ncbi:MAG: hypothetical protein L6Q81_06055 [Bacteroidia bacterium]|nr:hypothetical protein [Bacteroidia bacterium]
MSKTVAKFAGLMVVVLTIAVASFSVGCNKNKECRANVTVLTAVGGSPVVGAEVKLASGDVTMTASTDGSGTASFESQLPMILDIYVNGSPTGRVARLEEGKTDEVTIP